MSNIFGFVVVYVYAIKFHKWGLPRMYFLLYLREPGKMHSITQVDRIVHAEFLNPNTEHELFVNVITCMDLIEAIINMPHHGKSCVHQAFSSSFC